MDDGSCGPINVYLNSLEHVRAVLCPAFTQRSASSSSSASASASASAAPFSPSLALSIAECEALEQIALATGGLQYTRPARPNQQHDPALDLSDEPYIDAWGENQHQTVPTSIASRASAQMLSDASSSADLLSEQHRQTLFRRIQELDGRVKVVLLAQHAPRAHNKSNDAPTRTVTGQPDADCVACLSRNH
jgi:hypothetical protein